MVLNLLNTLILEITPQSGRKDLGKDNSLIKAYSSSPKSSPLSLKEKAIISHIATQF